MLGGYHVGHSRAVAFGLWEGSALQQAWRAFGYLVPWLALGILVAIPLVALLGHRRRRRHGESWPIAASTVAVRVGAIGALLLVIAITLDPLGGVGAARTSTNWVPFATIADQITSSVDVSVAVRNVLFNVLLFVPIGAAWALVAHQAGRTWLQAVAAGAGLSLLIELAQLLLPLGRAVDVDDVLLNSLGVLLGALAGEAVRRIARSRHRMDTAGVRL